MITDLKYAFGNKNEEAFYGGIDVIKAHKLIFWMKYEIIRNVSWIVNRLDFSWVAQEMGSNLSPKSTLYDCGKAISGFHSN